MLNMVLYILSLLLNRNRLIFFRGLIPKKSRSGPQNGSEILGPEKLLKIVNCVIIKETKKLKETLVGP